MKCIPLSCSKVSSFVSSFSPIKYFNPPFSISVWGSKEFISGTNNCMFHITNMYILHYLHYMYYITRFTCITLHALHVLHYTIYMYYITCITCMLSSISGTGFEYLRELIDILLSNVINRHTAMRVRF